MKKDLAPFYPPLGPQPARTPLYQPYPVTLVMKEKVLSLSGDDFKVETTDGAQLLKVKGKYISIRDKKRFKDASGKELFTLSNKMLKLHKSFKGESPDGYDFAVKGHFSFASSKSSVEFKNQADGAPIELRLKGDWFDRKASIKLGDRPVAQITRKLINGRELFFDKQTYFVTVVPNVDLSLIAAICVCLDERENED
ncbi:hypothetical protein PRZ48_002101 [Zasmidium cellare]|uniref:Uncharacterized protein n=1 Tax=Zasmidium cellare TaxID=395010 RepID=A0ABR0F534_ZASCE|nr:hypothetical protein PRZ48_002101 [Zasmidium cellare]